MPSPTMSRSERIKHNFMTLVYCIFRENCQISKQLCQISPTFMHILTTALHYITVKNMNTNHFPLNDSSEKIPPVTNQPANQFKIVCVSNKFPHYHTVYM